MIPEFLPITTRIRVVEDIETEFEKITTHISRENNEWEDLNDGLGENRAIYVWARAGLARMIKN